MGDGCARDWGAGTSIGGKKMSLHEKGDQTRAPNHNSDFSARFRVDFFKFANVCEFHFRNLSKRPFILPRIPCGFIDVSKPVSSVCILTISFQFQKEEKPFRVICKFSAQSAMDGKARNTFTRHPVNQTAFQPDNLDASLA